MEIILLQDVKSLGKKGEVVSVNDGYARNYILPKKLGMEANKKNINELKQQKAKAEKKQKEILDEARAFAKEINDKTIQLSIKVGEGGKTFGSISTKEISNAVKQQLGYDIEKKKMQLSESIKSIGIYSVSIKLHPKVTAELKVKVDSAQ